MNVKNIVKEYKESYKYFLTNPVYISIIVITAILSYGFAITNYSIGVDDVCLDRYVSGTWILSSGRWGTWLLYNILGIKFFTPFWIECIATILLIITVVSICAFFKKNLKDKFSLTPYIIFATTYLSYPLINQAFIFQTTNISIMLNTLMMILAGVVIYENYKNENKISIYVLLGIIMSLPISMYESCCQTFIVWILIIAFMENCFFHQKESIKKIIILFMISILVLASGIVTNFIVNRGVEYILVKTNTKEIDQAIKTNQFYKDGVSVEDIKELLNKLVIDIDRDIEYNPPVKTFVIVSILSVIVNCVVSIKKDKISNIYIMLLMLFSNFILFFIQGLLLYRAYMSWSLTVAFLVTFLYIICSKKKVLRRLSNIIIVFFILQQTRMLNQYFYNDNMRYNQEKAMSYEIANNILETCDDPTKPLIYTMKIHEEKMKAVYANLENGTLVIPWGYSAFGEYGTETTKFINALGYNFTVATQEEYKKALNEIKEQELEKDSIVIEKENYIIVQLDYFGLKYSDILLNII